ncbi:MAG: hypothetical protein C5B50_20720, partial [Verrucomicrobia bacterium]
MKKNTNPSTRNKPAPAPSKTKAALRGLIHPVVMYPFKHPGNHADLEALFGLVERLNAEKELYARPITVIDQKTHLQMAQDEAYDHFRKNTVARCSDVLDEWCVDTCQMWYSGLGKAFSKGRPGDVYWLIPGDFNYGSHTGQEVLGHLHDLPEIVSELDQDVCIGE